MIFVLIHCFGHISGAHINPAVTVTLMVARRMDVVKGCLYIVAQCLASIASSGILMSVMGLRTESMGGYNALTGPEDNRIARGFVAEAILTFLLCFTVLATIDPHRATTGLGPLAIGMAVAVAHLVLVPITGCGINPARSLGPAVFAEAPAARQDLWVFLLAPMCGSVAAGTAYPLWFAQGELAAGLVGKFAADDAEADEATAVVPCSPASGSGSSYTTVSSVL